LARRCRHDQSDHAAGRDRGGHPPAAGGHRLHPLFLNIRRGTEDEFKTMMPHYEKAIAQLAEAGCDLIHPHGAPPFMVQGASASRDRQGAGRRNTRRRSSRVAQNHVTALKALKAKTIVGATYFPAKLNAMFAKYMRDAGFTVRAMDGIDVPFDKVQELGRAGLCAYQEQASSSTRAPTRSTCSGRAGARSTSSRPWSRICRCRWCIR
jgi:maleate cis-trans isomerase